MFRYNSQVVMHSPESFCEWWNPNHEDFSMKIQRTRLCDPKDLALHLLLHLNEDFDDDLLQDAMEILGY